jgi:fumarate reductase flavoprotein subunit
MVCCKHTTAVYADLLAKRYVVPNRRALGVIVDGRTSIDTDVVVVGTGIGGLAAAIEARDAGAQVIVLEKGDEPGGTTRLSAGAFWTFREAESYRAAAPNGDGELQRVVTNGLPDCLEWLDRLGVAAAPIEEVGPPRNALGEPEPIAGHPAIFKRVAVDSLLERCLARIAGDLHLGTAMRTLLTDGNGCVTGVLADTASGPVRINSGAVVLATGGFAASRELLQRYLTPWADHLLERCSAGLTGDGFLAATEIGAAPSDGGFGGFYGHCLPARPARFPRERLMHVTQQFGPIGLAVNLRGDRFADEGASRLEDALCVEVAKQPEATAFYIVDHPTYQRYLEPRGEFISHNMDKIALAKEAGGCVLVSDNLPDLCNSMAASGLPASRALRTLMEFNAAAAAGSGTELPIPKSGFVEPLRSPPFFAVKVQAGVTASYGGLKISPRGEVLARTGVAISGLFAAGVDVGNVNNDFYAGILSIGAVFGRLSGRAAALEALRREKLQPNFQESR